MRRYVVFFALNFVVHFVRPKRLKPYHIELCITRRVLKCSSAQETALRAHRELCQHMSTFLTSFVGGYEFGGLWADEPADSLPYSCAAYWNHTTKTTVCCTLVAIATPPVAQRMCLNVLYVVCACIYWRARMCAMCELFTRQIANATSVSNMIFKNNIARWSYNS